MTKQWVNYSCILALFISIASSHADDATTTPQTINLIPENTFVPPGFDDNDNAQIVLDGYLSDNCHKAGPVHVQIDQNEKKIYLQEISYYYPEFWCIQAITPYTQVVNLGVLSAGQYQIFALDEKNVPQPQGTLPISIASRASPDDFIYAPVQDATIDAQMGNTSVNLTLRGKFTSSCMSLKEVKVLYRTPHIIEVLPVANAQNGNCRPSSQPFETQVTLESPTSGHSLVYIRTLNGQSISKIIDF